MPSTPSPESYVTVFTTRRTGERFGQTEVKLFRSYREADWHRQKAFEAFLPELVQGGEIEQAIYTVHPE